METSGLAEEDLPFGRHDDLDNTKLATGYLLDCFQEFFEMHEISRRRSEDVKSLHHMTWTLETFWAFRCDRVGRLPAGNITVSRPVEELIDHPCLLIPDEVSRLSIFIYIH